MLPADNALVDDLMETYKGEDEFVDYCYGRMREVRVLLLLHVQGGCFIVNLCVLTPCSFLSPQATVFMDGMRKFYERELHEVRGELQFVYKKWSSSLVDCWRLRDERGTYRADPHYYLQRAQRSEELEARFKREAEASARAISSMKGELELLKLRCDKLEEDKRTVEIKNAGLEDAMSTLNTRVNDL